MNKTDQLKLNFDDVSQPICHYKIEKPISGGKIELGKYENETFDKSFEYKYNEGTLLKELEEYIKSTYTQHYVGKNNVQSLDLIFSAGHGIGFCAGDILKYASRYGKKKGYNREDILKILHYALLLLYRHDTEIVK